MAQYASYASSSPVSQDKMSDKGLQRIALSILNENQKFQPKYGKSFQPQKMEKADKKDKVRPFISSFKIFQDASLDICKKSNKTPELPLCVTRLITLENNMKFQNLSCTKENDSLCSEVSDEQTDEAKKDEQAWTCPYKEDIFMYLSNLEGKFRPRPQYMEKQLDITFNMRSVLVDWLIEVGEEYKLLNETIHLAVAYVDRFLSRMSVLRGKLQLVGTACLFVASKHEEIYPPEIKDFVYITDNTYTKKQILRMEQLVLSVLDFDLATPTAFTFLQLYCCFDSVSKKVLFLAQYICEISLLEAEPFIKYLPSQLGAACLMLANYILKSDVFFCSDLRDLTLYDIPNTWPLVQDLHEKYSCINSYSQQAVCDKYRSVKYQCVADIEAVKLLDLNLLMSATLL